MSCGEETQVFGALQLRPEFKESRCTFLLPGTHCKWVQIEHGVIKGLRTFLTGELYALLGSSSLFATGSAGNSDQEAAGFADGLAEGRRRQGVLGSLFRARFGQLREDCSRDWAQGFVSGLLLANECAEMAQDDRMPASIILIGDPTLAARYELALADVGVTADKLDADTCVLTGLEMLDVND